MPRPLRPIAPALIYHIINRGNNRQRVFYDESDFQAFLKAMLDLKTRRPFDLFGYCLMSNHFHLLLKPRQDSISRIMQSLLASHTQRYHKYHSSGGHVWQGRYKSPVVQDDEHLLVVLRYIEANPLRGKLVKRAGGYRWSSFAAHGLGQQDELLSPCVPYQQLSPYPAVRQRRWNAYVHQSSDARELAAIRHSAERSLPYGQTAWVDRLAKKLNLDLTIRPRGRPKKETSQASEGG